MLKYRIMKVKNLKEDNMIKNSSRVDFSLPETNGLSRSLRSVLNLLQAPQTRAFSPSGLIRPRCFAIRTRLCSVRPQIRLAMTKPAFTLAEVLITLGIIGIVAAMTMPALIENHQSSVLQQRFKKAYSSMSQVFQRVAFEDYGGNMNIEYTQFGDIIEACNERIIKSSVCLYGQNNCDTTIFPFKNYEHPANIGNFLVSNYGIT